MVELAFFGIIVAYYGIGWLSNYIDFFATRSVLQKIVIAILIWWIIAPIFLIIGFFAGIVKLFKWIGS